MEMTVTVTYLVNPLQSYKQILTSLTAVGFFQTNLNYYNKSRVWVVIQWKLIPRESGGLTKQAGVFTANRISLEVQLIQAQYTCTMYFHSLTNKHWRTKISVCMKLSSVVNLPVLEKQKQSLKNSRRQVKMVCFH